jgi:hypothetical protein
VKRRILSLIFLFVQNFSVAQNLVPNPSFEDTVFCPWAENQMPTQWLCFGNTPDYYNSCSSALNVPNTPTGFHQANSGVGMIGVFIYVNPSSSGWPDYREFVGVPLIGSLSIGQKYYMSFFLSFGRRYPIGMGTNSIGADKLGMKFSTIPYAETTPPDLNNTAQLYTDSIYTDTLQWIKVSGSFIADSAYNYVMLGNFFDEANTDTLYFGGPNNWSNESYYFIDDICVSTDSIFNATWTAIEEPKINYSLFSIYPNPANDILNIEFVKDINEVSIINNLGQSVYENRICGDKKFQFNISHLHSGIYLVKVSMDSEILTKQIIINH